MDSRILLRLMLILALGVCFLMSCQTVPITGRQQLSLIPAGEILAMSFSSYQDFISKNKVVGTTEDARAVKQVGARIQRAVEQYFSDHGLSARLNGYSWEFNLVENNEINAWCMPGGKVVVYSGILPVTKNETGLAVVMGHEIAHAVANHGDERMSQGLVTQLGGMALSAALARSPQQTANLFMTAYGIGSQVGVLLPYSRIQESEADHLGLIFMAMAGYDPRDAVGFWQRMSQSKEGGAPPEFLSTHPADVTRIRNIQGLIPEALRYYRRQ